MTFTKRDWNIFVFSFLIVLIGWILSSTAMHQVYGSRINAIYISISGIALIVLLTTLPNKQRCK